MDAIDGKNRLGVKAIAERMELHQRIAFGFVPLVFSLLGVALVLLPRTSRANRSWGLMLCLFWLMIYYVLLSLGKGLGEKSMLHPIPATWLPNIVIGAIATLFFRKAMRESPLLMASTLERTAARAMEYLHRLRKP